MEIHACPVRFLNELEFSIGIGDTLSVTGSRPKKGPVVVAREITKGQLSVILREQERRPELAAALDRRVGTQSRARTSIQKTSP